MTSRPTPGADPVDPGRDLRRRPDAPGRSGSTGALPRGVQVVREETTEAPVPVSVHPGWQERFPWVVQGTTGRGRGGDPFDLALFGEGDPALARARWAELARVQGPERLVHGRQVHGATVRFHREGPPGLHLTEDGDGHVTRTPGVLLGVSVADCVPVFVVDAEHRAVAVLHAGWRGAAAGLLEAGLELMGDRLGSRPGALDVHLGPAICGSCYEVGPEVHEALGQPRPDHPRQLDLRAALAWRAVSAGVPAGAVSLSAWCTRCGGSPFFSHRGGDPERQVGFVGIRG